MKTAILAACTGALFFAFTPACFAEKNTSRLEPMSGEKGVFRYVEGDGSISALTLSARLSKTADRFIILVTTTKEYEAQALAHGKKLARWFEDNIDAISSVRIILEPSKIGVGYIFHISGLRYFDDHYAPKGVMGPQTTVDARQDVIITYKARMIWLERGDYNDVLD